MGVIPPSVAPHEHDDYDSSKGVNDQTDWNVVTLKQHIDSELRSMYAEREAVIKRIELAITNIHNEITIREVASGTAIDKAITQVNTQNEGVRRESEQRASSALEAVNTLAKSNEARFAKQEQLIGAVATLEVQLDATRRESSIINGSNQLAIDKAEAANEKRFASVNAFREQLAQQASQFMPRELAEAKINEATNLLSGRIAATEKTLTELRSWRDTQTGQSSGASASIGWVVTAVTVVVSILGVVIILANLLIQ